MISELTWEEILQALIYSSPTYVGCLVAVLACFVRRRENPRGATYLGLAVLVTLFATTAMLFWPFVIANLDIHFEWVNYGLLGFHGLISIVFWGLIIAAVFARPH